MKRRSKNCEERRKEKDRKNFWNKGKKGKEEEMKRKTDEKEKKMRMKE